jgi:hypothetical protein
MNDIVFDNPASFILEVAATIPGTIKAYSFDGSSFDYTSAAGETITIILS